MCTDHLLSNERWRLILDVLNREGKVYVASLAKRLGTSVVTVRKDLDHLAAKGLLVRTHGGAVRRSPVMLDLTLNEKGVQYAEEKKRIARQAADLVQNGDTIFIDAGSTTSLLVPYLGAHEGLTLITNSLYIATKVAEMPNVQLILVGGQFHAKSLAFIGTLAEQSLSLLTVEKCFLGIDALDLEKGITTPLLEERGIHRMMLEVSQQVIVLADSSKFGKRSLGVIADLKKIDRVITDAGISPAYRRGFKRLGIDVSIT